MDNYEAFRPLIHFTPATNWINDPNGLVYCDGEYHMFYQYHPYSTLWGPMHWGHAVSLDLVNWEERPIALYPDQHGQAFSGSAVIDHHNTTGFGVGVMVALFTQHQAEGHRQTQSLAFSPDRGHGWVVYPGNPLLQPLNQMRDFRDPKVFWYGTAEAGHWVMVLAAGGMILFYRSSNLIDWAPCGAFGLGEAPGVGVWETPDLVHLPVDGGEERRWVLIVSVGGGAPAGGSGTVYFVGEFDGESFTSSNPKGTLLWLDYGADAYAAQSWSNEPQGRCLIIQWMNNWDYARLIPTERWRGAMTMPRELGLVTTRHGLRLQQQFPVEVTSLRGARHAIPATSLSSARELVIDVGAEGAEFAAGALELTVDFTWPEDESVAFALDLCFGVDDVVTVAYDGEAHELALDRARSGVVDFHPTFPVVHHAPLSSRRGMLRLQLLIDVASLELLAGDADHPGLVAMTEQIFPRCPLSVIVLRGDTGSVEVTNMTLYALQATARPVARSADVAQFPQDRDR